MTNNVHSQGSSGTRLRKTLRLRFRVEAGEMRLLSSERLDMTCPPSVGERPEAGKHGGYWVELRDAQGRVLFHRLLDYPFGNSVEVHSPDRKIERKFGPVTDNVFEVLVPDEMDAKDIVLIGEPPEEWAAGAAPVTPVTRELLRFDLTTSIPPGGLKGVRP
jgi:hypothetical protein